MRASLLTPQAGQVFPSAAEVRLRHARQMAASHHCLMRTAALRWRLWRNSAIDPLSNRSLARERLAIALKDACVHRAAMQAARAEIKRLEGA